jgi:hypothetical protein
METKRCNKCGEEKPLTTDFWYVDRRKPDGVVCPCKSCCQARVRANQKNKELPSTRACCKCNESKPLTAEYWYRNRRHDSGYGWSCKSCHNLDVKDRYNAGGDYHNKQDAAGKLRRLNRRKKVLQHYSITEPPSCGCCGEDRFEFLAIDHINGGGNQHRKSIGENTGGGQIVLWIIKNNFPEGFRVLCHNCNVSLGNFGYCPHQNEKP